MFEYLSNIATLGKWSLLKLLDVCTIDTHRLIYTAHPGMVKFVLHVTRIHLHRLCDLSSTCATSCMCAVYVFVNTNVCG